MAVTHTLTAALDFHIAGSFSRTLSVIRRNVPTIAALYLVFGVLPVALFWLIAGFSPSHIERLPPAARLPQLGLEFVLSTAFAAAAAKVVIADRLHGRRITPWQALLLPPRRYASLYVAAFLIALASNLVYVFSNIGMLPEVFYVLSGFGMIAVEATVSGLFAPTIPIVVEEDVSGPEAVRRAFALTRGYRLLLIAAFGVLAALLFLAKFATTNLLTDFMLTHGVGLDRADFLRSLYWEAFSAGESILFATWVPVLYLTLRRVREGLSSPQVVELFA